MNRHERKESKRFKSYTYEELIKRDKINLDIFWLKNEALEESANLPAPAATQFDSEAGLSNYRRGYRQRPSGRTRPIRRDRE